MPERWHAWPVARVFPGSVPGTSPSGARVTYVLAGVAPEAPCRVAFQPGVLRLLRGCVTALRATYADSTQTFVATVGIAVLVTPAAHVAAEPPPPLGGDLPGTPPKTGSGRLSDGSTKNGSGCLPGGLSRTSGGCLPAGSSDSGSDRLPRGPSETGSGCLPAGATDTGNNRLPSRPSHTDTGRLPGGPSGTGAGTGRLPGRGPETGTGPLPETGARRLPGLGATVGAQADAPVDRSGTVVGRPPTVRPVAFPDGPAERFGESQYVTGALISSNDAYVVATAAGYADGRPYKPGDLAARRLGDTAHRLATVLYRSLTR
ncbi:hypothetical protein [Nonomuraea sp. NEAU-A123]|uniref:hypothetical protein n=1 Tax=Nonomuraea sp. NEAU-A123 TaxID=2839649 RepID=UPI001BE40B5A|nr:hypothetical protein [Nonomuraea sp. NEAU-A123]MBT2235609.1 hypothetical protein [Nonomuraea sp. NEAU-A123]